MADIRTTLSIYQSGSDFGSPRTDRSDVTHLTKQFIAGRSFRQWLTANIQGLAPGWTVSSRQIGVNTPSISAPFISVNVKNSNPSTTTWPDWVIDIYHPTRAWVLDDLRYTEIDGYNDYDQLHKKFDPWSGGIGIAIRMERDGNDIVMPNGRSQIFYSTPNNGVVALDYNYTFTTVQNGVDSVVGGFGPDIILSESISHTEAEENFRVRKLNPIENDITGKKLFVGGSDDDFLSGGKDDDFLIGDRLNNYELYLNRAALEKNIPDAFSDNRKRLLNYQPPDYNAAPVNRFDRGLGGYISVAATVSPKPPNSFRLLRPGNDTIRGNGGNDTIYGDGNINDINELYNYKTEAQTYQGWKRLPSGKDDWTKLRIGADFIDGGTGNDEIYAGYGSDAVIGGQGYDVIFMGDQIIAPDYQPLWGPKIVWGNAYNDLKDLTPDLFILGDLYTSEEELKSTDAAKYDEQKAKEKEVKTTWTNIIVNLGAQAFSKATYGLSGLAKTIFNYFTTKNNSSEKIAQEPTVLDGTTVIRDFGPRDLLAVKIRKNELLEASPTSLEANANGVYPFNPLVGNGTKGFGYKFTNSPAAGKAYTRLMLEGYSGKLYEIARVDSNTSYDGLSITDGATYLLLGGSDYANGKFPIWNPGGLTN